MDEFEIEIKKDFLSEATDMLSEAEEVFLALDSGDVSDELLNQLFRVAHNLKGTSKAVGFDQVSELTHVAENLILKIQNKEIELVDPVIEALFKFKDKVSEMIETYKSDLEAMFELTDTIGQLEEVTNGNFEKRAEAIDEDPEEILSEENNTSEDKEELIIHEDLQDEREKTPIVESAPPKEPVPEQKPTPIEAKKKPLEAVDEDEDIRVKLSRINKVNDYIGELVILQTVLNQKQGTEIKDELACKSIKQMNKIFKELQSVSMSLRMLPLKSTFQRMQRIVRDTSKMLGKEVNLNLLGENTEVDKKIVEFILDPLVHIVRNGVDHGIESPEERESSGKQRAGQIELFAFHEGSNLVIQITDDGKGINAEILREKAIAKGIINENQKLAEEEIIQLVFHPGFSTKDQVSEVSGRGVGMDVVKSNIERLGGKVRVKSKVGVGSSFRIELPLTLAIVDGLVIDTADHLFALPLSQVQEIVQVNLNELEEATNGGIYFRLRNNLLPVLKLCDALRIKEKDKRDSYTAITTKTQEGTVCILVDNVLYRQQVVIKELGQDLKGYKGLVGATILGDGKASFIVDFNELFKDSFRLTMRSNQMAA